ncbi:hypothetical protein N9N28_06730 [Rubripirellula amarantea]|uniref:Uncharacterized protein n=1 Tax=Rubripirellula amarantea TaxID=2527999 RepID=A0A5C5WUZ8_9BACT|nr:hypothetical protein [Rubripirellula amarantea]MDA8744306.1 hypothetical protein [Rubripirellula amarantea]TWT53833.1 hypothetical protein Pla22_14670 [Rubripirellula amarantea]
MSSDKGQIETLKDAVIDEDKKLGEEVPGAPFAVVGLTYPVVLAIVLMAFALFYWLT